MSPSFIEAQRRLARYLRNPLQAPPPESLSGDRLEVYRHAVRHNIGQFMADNFPRVRASVGEDAWESLLDTYLARHPARVAAFSRLPGEFISFLNGHHAPASLPRFVHELAHFEWLENAIACDERTVPNCGVKSGGDLLDAPLVINPVHELASYDYPVHILHAEDASAEPTPRETHLVVFRDAGHKLHVLDLNPVTRTLFEQLRSQPAITAREVLLAITEALGHTAPQVVLRGGLEILERMRQRGLILGTC